MKIKVRCDCGKTLVAPDRLAGKRTRCPSCGAVVRLPQLDAEPEQPASFFVTETGLNLTTDPQEGCAAPAEEMPHPFNFSPAEQTPVTSPECESSLGASDSSNAMNDGSGRELSTFAPPQGEGEVRQTSDADESRTEMRQVGAKMRDLERIMMVIFGLLAWLLTLGSPSSAWVLVHYLALAAVVIGITLEITDRVPGLKSRVQVVLGWLRERLKALWDTVEIKKTWRVIGGVSFVLIAAFVVLPFILGGRRELKTEEIVARSEAAVAFIKGEGGSGSGFLISKGLVITNAHVLDDEFMENVEIHFPSGAANDKGPFKAKLVYEDSQRDLAVISINSKATPLKLAKAFTFRRGQDITVIGSPGVGGHVLKNAVSRGVMSTEMEIDSQKFYQLGIAINPGNSGGPVFDSYGDVVGVITARATEQEGLAFSVPLSDVRIVLVIASESRMYDDVNVERADSRHRVVVLARRIASASRLSLRAMYAYNEAMEIALKDRRRAQDGLNMAQALLHEKMNTANLWLVDSGARALVPKVGADQNLSEEVRRRFVDLWTNYDEIRDYVDHPRGNSDTYRVKTIQLDDQHKRSVEAMKVSLGLTDL